MPPEEAPTQDKASDDDVFRTPDPVLPHTSQGFGMPANAFGKQDSFYLSGKDLLDILNVYDAGNIGAQDPGSMRAGLDGGFGDIPHPPNFFENPTDTSPPPHTDPLGFNATMKSNVMGQAPSTDPAQFQNQMQMAFGMAGISGNYSAAASGAPGAPPVPLSGSARLYNSLGRCMPVGGAYSSFYAPGFDDKGYAEPPKEPPPGSLRASEVDPALFRSMKMGTDLSKMNFMEAPGGPTLPNSNPSLAVPPSHQGTLPVLEEKKNVRQRRSGKDRVPHPVVEKARRDGINALIESLRAIVPVNGWSHGPREETTVDKRTKRSVLMDTIASIQRLEHAVAQSEKLLANAGVQAEAMIYAQQQQQQQQQEVLQQSGRHMDAGRMMQVDVDIIRSEEDQFFVKIEYFDRRGFLADQCVAMRSLGLTIKSASLPKPERNGHVRDIFEVEPLDKDAADLDALKEQLQEALNETQSMYYEQDKVGGKRTRT